MTKEITAYLVGKVGPGKWNMVKAVAGAKFISSDGGDHSTHDWGFGNWDFTEPSLQEQLRLRFIDQIENCQCLIAFLTEPTCFGGIAEIAYASRMGIKCYMILTTGMPDAASSDDEESFTSKMRDAYWFISNFPNVRAFEVTTEGEARQLTQAIIEAHIAPENAAEILEAAYVARIPGPKRRI